MKYLIVEPKVKSVAPNIALMKFSRWCEVNGHEYRYVRGKIDVDFVPDKILMSCIFTYYAKYYEETIDYYLGRFSAVKILVGGVFPTINSAWFDKPKWDGRVCVFHGMCKNIEDLPPKYNVEIQEIGESKRGHYARDRIVLYASKGCVNKCGYCAVPKLEGAMRSFKSIKPTLELAREEMPDAKSVVLYDNNFTEHKYFDDIIDELVEFGLPVEFNQGVHFDAFTRHHAERFAELNWTSHSDSGTTYLRFGFDFVGYWDHVERALGYVIDSGIKASFFCYMLYNWKDTPHDFWKRLVLAQDIVDRLGRSIFLFPQRYEPFESLMRNQFIGEHWNSDLVIGIQRMCTFIHGFFPITSSRNLFNWIGYNEEEFLGRAIQMSIDRKYRLEKKDGTPPLTKAFLERL